MLNSVLDSMHDNESRKPEASSSFGAQRASSTPSSSSAEPLPTVGPDYYELRRQQWLRPTTSSSSAAAVNDDVQSTSSSSSSGPVGKKNRQEKEKDSSKARLEELLSAPGAEEDEELWKTYLHTVHDGLVGGKKFKRGIKLSMAVKILKAGWLRDGTWDVAAAASMNSIPTTTTTTIIAAGPSTSIAQATSPTASSRRHSSAIPSTTGFSASRGLRALLTGGRHLQNQSMSYAINPSIQPVDSAIEPPSPLWSDTNPNSPTSTARGWPRTPISAGSTKSSFFGSTISKFLPAALATRFGPSSVAGADGKRIGRQTRSESWPVVRKESVPTLVEDTAVDRGQDGKEQGTVEGTGNMARNPLS